MLKLSIITPSFNQGKFIEQTIQSVLSQGYPNLEYIVIDGGSTDNTIEILKKYEGRLKWISEKDNGQSDAINKGLRMATGDIVAWINSDDFYLPGTLHKIADLFIDEKTQWITGDYRIIDEEGKEIQSFVRLYKRLLGLFSSRFMLSIANYVNQPSTFWRKSLMEKSGYVNEAYRYCMDYDLWFRFMKYSAPRIIRTPLSAFRIHKASKGGSQYKKQFEEEITIAAKNNVSRLVLFVHKIHNSFITFIYSFIKEK